MFLNQNNLFTKAYFISIFLSIYSYADISGIVFRDLPLNGSTLNRYGVKDSNELGVQGIVVTAYPENLSTTTDINGSWSLSTTVDSRVEFSNIPSYLKESPNAQVENSSVRFVTNGSSNIYFGVHNPDDFTDTANPFYVTNRQQNGSGLGNTNPSIERVHYKDSGLNQEFQDRNLVQGTGPIPIKDTTVEEVGSIWGKAYQKNKKRLFVSAVLQRHVGFAPTKGAGEVYILDYNNSTPQTVFKGSFSLQGITPSNGGNTIDLGSVCRSVSCKDDLGNSGVESDYVLPSDITSPNIDLDAFAKVGKMSYGDIDFDQVNNRLWLVNLYQKALISLDASGELNSLTSDVKQYQIESIPNVPTCIGGELRPWALAIHKQKGYLGAVCDASVDQNISNLKAHILSFDVNNPNSGFTEVLSFGLDYTKDANNPKKNWHPWSDDSNKSFGGGTWKYYIQPILSDIEFDEKDTMYISFLDRYGLQSGYKNYRPISNTTTIEEKTKSFGDIFRVCNNNGHFELEGTGSCTQTNYGNEFFNDEGGDTSEEYASGALALLKGSKEIVVSVIDPHPEGDRGDKYWNTMGQNILSTEDGSIHNWYANIYSGKNYGYNGKSQGMGDIELITADAPIEIGDRVWLDIDGDGIQDANESGLSDVTVELVCDNRTVATAKTDSNGYYIFSNDPNSISTTSYIYNIAELVAGVNNCLIRIPDINGTNKQSALANDTLTISHQGEGFNSKINDSDGVINGNNAESIINPADIKVSGTNNHSFDFGFKPNSIIITTGSWSGRVSEDTDGDNIGDRNLSNITIKLFNDINGDGQPDGNATATTDTNSSGEYIFNNLPIGNYVAIEIQPANFISVTENEGGDDNDMPDNNTTNSIAGIVTAGENDSGNDFVERAIATPQQPTPPSSGGRGGGGFSSGGGSYTTGSSSSSNEPPLLESSGGPTEDNITIGDRVWLDSDKDGIQDRSEVGVANIVVSLYQSNCTTLVGTDITDSNGYYLFEYIDEDRYCIKFSNISTDRYGITQPNMGDDTKDSDANPATITIDNIDSSQWAEDINLSFDLGLTPKHIDQNESNCSLEVFDDNVEANSTSRVTTIYVLNNDCENINRNNLSFLNIEEGRALWREGRIIGDRNITLVGNRLVVDGEGVWTIENGVIRFTADEEFDGQIPTPVYYIAQSDSGIKSNVARVSIETPCNCKTYHNSIPTLTNIGILLITLITSILALIFKRELN